MVEGDNSSGETDKDGDIYHNYRVNYVYITFDGAQILAGSLVHPPAHSSPICLFCLVFHFLAACPLTPHFLNMLPTAASVWKLSCSLTGGSALVIRIMTADEQCICCSQIFLMALGALWASPHDSIHPGTGQLVNQSVASHRLWLWFTDAELQWHLPSLTSYYAQAEVTLFSDCTKVSLTNYSCFFKRMTDSRFSVVRKRAGENWFFFIDTQNETQNFKRKKKVGN